MLPHTTKFSWSKSILVLMDCLARTNHRWFKKTTWGSPYEDHCVRVATVINKQKQTQWSEVLSVMIARNNFTKQFSFSECRYILCLSYCISSRKLWYATSEPSTLTSTIKRTQPPKYTWCIAESTKNDYCINPSFTCPYAIKINTTPRRWHWKCL